MINIHTLHSITVAGEDHGPGEAAAAGHVHRQRAGGRRAVPSQGEEGVPVRAAGHLQRTHRQEEGLLLARVHF